MVKQDIPTGWEWLRSLSDEEWRITINGFFKSKGLPSRIPYSAMVSPFIGIKNLRKDVERIHEIELSTWFCELKRIPA